VEDQVDQLQLLRHLLIRTLFDGLDDQMGLVVQSQLDNTKYVLYRNGDKLELLELEDQTTPEWTTISYGSLN